jgi:hypothetical protein
LRGGLLNNEWNGILISSHIIHLNLLTGRARSAVPVVGAHKVIKIVPVMPAVVGKGTFVRTIYIKINLVYVA